MWEELSLHCFILTHLISLLSLRLLPTTHPLIHFSPLPTSNASPLPLSPTTLQQKAPQEKQRNQAINRSSLSKSDRSICMCTPRDSIPCMHATPKIRSQICPARPHKTPSKVQVNTKPASQRKKKERRRTSGS
jgi:hypothetical protein